MFEKLICKIKGHDTNLSMRRLRLDGTLVRWAIIKCKRCGKRELVRTFEIIKEN